MSRVYTYRTAARRVGRSIDTIRYWKRWYGMRTHLDEEGYVRIPEAELLRCYRLACARSYQLRHRRRATYRQDALFDLDDLATV